MRTTKLKLMVGTIILLITAFIAPGQSQTDIRELVPNQTIEREMTGNNILLQE
jgi:hypothetical protein